MGDLQIGQFLADMEGIKSKVYLRWGVSWEQEGVAPGNIDEKFLDVRVYLTERCL